MSKGLIIGVIVTVLAGLGVAIFFSRNETPGNLRAFTDEDLNAKRAALAAEAGQTNTPTQAVLVPIDLSHPLRLAIGGLGLADEDQNRQLGDLVTAGLTGERGFDLVERQSLSAILHELNLSWSGFVRAKDAVRAGKLLKADWFLLGTEANLNGTNSMVVRVVDARTGVMRDAGVFPADKSSTHLAADLAAFLRQCRQSAASAKVRVYLAVGAFEDLSVNNRQADFPTQLRGYLTAAYRGSSVTLLEREYVETLLQEVRLDLAGLTEAAGPNPPPAMQSAFWLVSGQYQSYETTNVQVEVNLDVRRVFGKHWQRTVRELPGEAAGQKIKASIDEVMAQNSGALAPNRVSEAQVQMEIGKDLMVLNNMSASRNPFGYQALVFVDRNPPGNVWMDKHWRIDQQLAAQQRHNLEEAVRAFETVLLLEPTNQLAKMCLAACLRNTAINRPDEACRYYQEIIEEPLPDVWAETAKQALGETLRFASSEEKLRRFQAAATATTNPVAAAFYAKQAEAAGSEVTINSGGIQKAEELAEKKLFAAIESCGNVIHGKSGSYNSRMGMDDYAQFLGPDQAAAAQKLVELLPRMKSQAPDLEPYLTATVLTFQVDTNTPLVAEFQKSLDDCIDHPDRVLNPGQFWSLIRQSVYEWCLEKTNYPLAIHVIEGERQANSGDFDDQEKIKLAYLYLAVERWQDALAIAESFTNRPVKMFAEGVWGRGSQPVFTDKLAAYCRKKLGVAVAQDPRIFDMGKPLLCLCSPSTFVADDNGLWVGIGGRLLHLDFDLKTNLDVKLPVDETVPITALGPTSSTIWIGTRGEGLIEFDKASRQCRRLTEADGLMMNSVASLEITGDLLWIGYGGATGGGLGQLDLPSRKLHSFMPALNADPTARSVEIPPRGAVEQIIAGADGDLWMLAGSVVRQFHVARGVWETLPKGDCEWVACFSANSEYLIEGGGIRLIEIGIQDKASRNAPPSNALTNDFHRTNLVVSSAELDRLQADLRTNGSHRYLCSSVVGKIGPKGALAIQNLRDHRWQNLEDADGLSNPPSTLTLDGNDLWVGGEGVIALVDLKAGKVRKFCHVKAETVDRIQIAGGYVWAQFDWHLYRAPLSALR